MSRLHLSAKFGGDRFPGFDVMDQSKYWDDPTKALVLSRLDTPSDLMFFSQSEGELASALFDLLLAQHEEPRIPIVNMVDSRLALGETDGWHYEDIGPDDEAWRNSLQALEQEAKTRTSISFTSASRRTQEEILQHVFDLGARPWRGMRADRIWSLWTRYACSAFYSHPWAWQEIGFAGPAYPRGYKNLGIDRREPFEVPDAHRDEAAGEAIGE